MRYKILLFAAFLTFNSAVLFAQNHTVTVVVDEIKKTEGAIMIAAFQDGTMKFLDKDRVAAQKLDVEIPSVTTDFSLPEGKYVFVSYQDLNGNLILDTNFIGYPKEPYAISNNLVIPRYKAAEVHVVSDTTIMLNF